MNLPTVLEDLISASRNQIEDATHGLLDFVWSIYATCQRLADAGVTINRPPRDGHMAFVRSPEGISVELLQKGGSLPKAEPWSSMPNVGVW